MLSNIKNILQSLSLGDKNQTLLDQKTLNTRITGLMSKMHFISNQDQDKLKGLIASVITEIDTNEGAYKLSKDVSSILTTLDKPESLDLLLKILECGLDGSLHADIKDLAEIADDTQDHTAYNILDEASADSQIKQCAQKIIRRSSSKAETAHILNSIITTLNTTKELQYDTLQPHVKRLMRFAKNANTLQESINHLKAIVTLLVTEDKKQAINQAIDTGYKEFSKKTYLAKKIEYSLELLGPLIHTNLSQNIKEQKLTKLIQEFSAIDSLGGEEAIAIINKLLKVGASSTESIDTSKLLELIKPFLKYKAQDLKTVCKNNNDFNSVIQTASALLGIDISNDEKQLICDIMLLACKKCEANPLFKDKHSHSESEELALVYAINNGTKLTDGEKEILKQIPASEEQKQIINKVIEGQGITDAEKTKLISSIQESGALKKKEIFLNAFRDSFVEKLWEEKNSTILLGLACKIIELNLNETQKTVITNLISGILEKHKECTNSSKPLDQKEFQEAIYHLFSQKIREEDVLLTMLEITAQILKIDISESEKTVFSGLIKTCFEYGDAIHFTGSEEDLIGKIPEKRHKYLYQRCCEIVLQDKIKTLQQDQENDQSKNDVAEAQKMLNAAKSDTNEETGVKDLLTKILQDNKEVLQPECIAELQAHQLQEILTYIAKDNNLETLLGFLPKILNIARTKAGTKLLQDYSLSADDAKFSQLLGKILQDTINTMGENSPLKKILSQLTSNQTVKNLPADVKVLKKTLESESAEVNRLKEARGEIIKEIEKYESNLLRTVPSNNTSYHVYCRVGGIQGCKTFNTALQDRFQPEKKTEVSDQLLKLIQAHTDLQQAIIENNKSGEFQEKYQAIKTKFDNIEQSIQNKQLADITQEIGHLQRDYDVMYCVKQGFHAIDGKNCPNYLSTEQKSIWQFHETADDLKSILIPQAPQEISLPINFNENQGLTTNIKKYKEGLSAFCYERAGLAGQLMLDTEKDKMSIELAAQTTSDLLNIHNSKNTGKAAYSIITNAGIAGRMSNKLLSTYLSKKLASISEKQSSIIEMIKTFDPLKVLLRQDPTAINQGIKKPNITAAVAPHMTLKQKIQKLIARPKEIEHRIETTKESSVKKPAQSTISPVSTGSNSKQKPPSATSNSTHTKHKRQSSDDSNVVDDSTNPPNTYLRRIDPPTMSAAPYLGPAAFWTAVSVAASMSTHFFPEKRLPLNVLTITALACTLVILAFYGVQRYKNNKQEIRYEQITTIEGPVIGAS